MEQDKNEIEIFSSLNDQEINQVCAILSDNNIPFLKKDFGSGSYLNIVMGQSIQEKKIFVNEDCYDKAMELISAIVSSDNFEEDTVQELEEAEEENDDSNKKYRRIKYLLFFCIFGIPWLLSIILIIIYMLQSN